MAKQERSHKMSKANPQELQGFHPFKNKDEVQLLPGDYLAATGEYDSTNRTTVTVFGATYIEEMLDWYVLVIVKRTSKFRGLRCSNETNTNVTERILRFRHQLFA